MYACCRCEGDKEHEEHLLATWGKLEESTALLHGIPLGEASKTTWAFTEAPDPSRERRGASYQGPLAYVESLGAQSIDKAEAL